MSDALHFVWFDELNKFDKPNVSNELMRLLHISFRHKQSGQDKILNMLEVDAQMWCQELCRSTRDDTAYLMRAHVR